ncbi:hypothetical protein DLE54_00425 [Psychrobacter sp. YP14]|uniref:VRR-NUC domain-containing protein n=1 Tax=Psychrobacter sp. YP14 TaxID=2203895 RepID=UPI000D7E4930|nr:VRR-NUC domain-containing protein [Psychrobacter sp. YP14]AWT48141.1 hypothetical protein DLE54_00425 [Psychrobacter sp. YP14]
MSIEKQCINMQLGIDILKLHFEGSPEKAALEYFIKQGYVGTYNEGYMFQNTMKALILDELTRLNTFNSRNDACTRFLEAQLTIHENHIDKILFSIKGISKSTFTKNLAEIIAALKTIGMDNGLSLEVGLALFDALDIDTFINLIRKFSEDPYSYRKGWPDLTLVRDSEVKLVEVKTTDKLHKSQIKTIPMLIDVLGNDISVLKIIKPL